MDTLRGNFVDRDDMFDDASAYDTAEKEIGGETPPDAIGQDERRMQVRAYNHWTSLLEDRNFPSISSLHADDLPDFGPYSVLLDFTAGIENPGVTFLGEKLAEECDTHREISRLSDVPTRSLLSRITDHYMQILANQAPIGFEAEFVNQRGRTILYRGILLPFSSDDDKIDFIYGVINWKELADQHTADELLLEIDQALDEVPEPSPKRIGDEPMPGWADGPATAPGASDVVPFDLREEAEAADLPRPHFGPHPEFDDGAAMDGGDAAEFAFSGIDEAEMGLGDLLAVARDFAEIARTSEERTRSALYDAISRAYDFSLAAAAEPEEFRELLEASGLSVQDRAPMTPIVKLVFGADYDKTRLTEYASALNHAYRLGLERGALGDFLRTAEGGLKGVVKTERRLRREETGKPAGSNEAKRVRIAERLRQMEPVDLAAIKPEGQEFGLVLIRRMPSGQVAMLGEIPEDTGLVERAARKLLA